MERDCDKVTPGPWEWVFMGNAGNYFLVGNEGNGPICNSGPNCADGKLMQSAPALQAENERLREACQMLIAYRDTAGPLNFQLEKADDFINLIRAALARRGE